MTAHSNPVLSSIIKISEKLEGSKLSESILKEINEQLLIVSEFLKTDTTEALFFILIFALENHDNENVNLHMIAEYLDLPFLHLLEYRYVLDLLEDDGYIFCGNGQKSNISQKNNGYNICSSISNSVIEGKELIATAKESFNLESGISKITEIMQMYANNAIDSREYIRQIISFEKKLQHLELFKNVLQMFPEDIESRILIYYFSYAVIYGYEFDAGQGRGVFRQRNAFKYIPNFGGARRNRALYKGNDILIKEKILEKYFCQDDGPVPGNYVNYKLSQTGIKKLFGNSATEFIYPDEETTELDEIIIAIKNFSHVYEDDISRREKMTSLINLEEENKKFKYFTQFDSLIPNNVYRWFYFECVSDFICGGESSLCSTLRDLFGRGGTYFDEMHLFVDEKHFLIENGFLEIIQNEDVEKTCLTLTDKSIELLYGEHAELYKRKNTSKNVIKPEELKEKKLFYSADIQGQIDMLCESLSQEKLSAIQERLEKKCLTKGVAVILYGAPGTGKTETVYQLAKKTNRKILHVDIADSKSMWFGESEKRIKKIFTDYRSLCRSCKNHNENMPILLFNEADALISKRSRINNGGSEQTENSMQNILLEEMEKLDGIMIATTNLCENMDDAFERRFLFKIKYEKPSIESRSKIWMNKLSYMSKDDVVALATQFDFSGGEIDNIVRKGEIDEIITGIEPTYERIVELCKKERLEKSGERKLGFAC